MRNKIISAFLGGALLAVTVLTPTINVSAETTFSSADELIEDVLTTAIADIASSTKDAAIDAVTADITITNDEIFYDGASIGYWYSDSSDCLYADSARTETLIEGETNGYTVDPDLLTELLTDVNAGLTETYEPTTSDWSKIIGKYDITLGDIMIPADNWAELPTDGSEYVNISKLTGVTTNSPYTGGTAFKKNWVFAFSWLIDENGSLYISSGITSVGSNGINTATTMNKLTHIIGSDTLTSGYVKKADGSGGALTTVYNWITLGANITTTSIDPVFTLATDQTLATEVSIQGNDETFTTLRSIDDPSLTYSGNIADANKQGVAWFVYDWDYSNSTDSAALATAHNNFLTSQTANKTIVGNSLLSKRITKISNLNVSDVLVISSTGWTVNDVDIDEFLGTQVLITAGSAADMSVAVEVESKNFQVVLPTTLPVYVALDGTVSTATNAAIVNESNAAVEITEIAINAAPAGGWTLVDTIPSTDEGATEFSFSTSLNVGDRMDVDETLPFTYDAAFSPTIFEVEELDAATVSVTLDWAA